MRFASAASHLYKPHHLTGGHWPSKSRPVVQAARLEPTRPPRNNRRRPWRCPISPCASCWKLACTSAIRPTAGTRRWRRTSSAPATTFTSSISPRRVPMLHRALQAVSDTVAKGGRILFVGTKRQAQDADRRSRQALRAVLRQLALARRHADQLEDDLRARSRGCASSRRCSLRTRPAATPRRSASTCSASATSSTARSAASRTWAACPTWCSSSTPTRKTSRSRRRGGSTCRSRRSSTPIAIPTASPSSVPGNDDASRAISLYCDLIATRRDRRHLARAGRHGRRHRRGREADRRGRADRAG